MKPSLKIKTLSLACIVLSIVVYGITFDRGWLALAGPTLLITGLVLSYLVIKTIHSQAKALIPIVLWITAIIINRASASYEVFSRYRFVDPMNGFILSGCIVIAAFFVIAYYFFMPKKVA